MCSLCTKCVRRIENTDPRERPVQRGVGNPLSANDAKSEINQAPSLFFFFKSVSFQSETFASPVYPTPSCLFPAALRKFYLNFFTHVFIFERERASESGRGREREGDTESEAGSRL